MVDPLSISASIIAVLQLSSTVVGYLKDVNTAAEERRQLLLEISSVAGYLYMLKDSTESANHHSSPALRSLAVHNGPLEQFKETLEGLVKKLLPTEGVRRIGSVLTWPFQKKEIQDFLSRIERQKSSFMLALQNDNV